MIFLFLKDVKEIILLPYEYDFSDCSDIIIIITRSYLSVSKILFEKKIF
tara:strand:- start:15 stop:161 length:147 start_codon:yes stop_codon:yes gene_type:complete